MRINKHDTNGVKPLLGKGELGYDDYTAGGDAGRVYVGTGTENIALAEKLEANIMTKAQFNALAEERKANRAGSGFDEWGKHYSIISSFPNINEGIWSAPTTPNIFRLGESVSPIGISKTNHPEITVAGTKLKIFGVNQAQTYGERNEILLPTASNIYPYDTVLTAEQIASGVIKHADASNSGLIVNGKFDTDTSGWIPYETNGNISIVSGRIRATSVVGNAGIIQTIATVIGKSYIIEGEFYKGTTTTTAALRIGTSYQMAQVSSLVLSSDGRFTLTFTATSTTTYIGIRTDSTVVGQYIEFDNIAVYPADAISRSDLVFLESWHEDISEKNFVYPLGNVQYLGADTDGLTGIANGAFTGFETYSLFGNFQASSALIGKGYVWNTLTEVQKKAFISNSDNNCYLDGDKVIQVRYRVRVVQGKADSLFYTNVPASLSYPILNVGSVDNINNRVAAQGKSVLPKTPTEILTYGAIGDTANPAYANLKQLDKIGCYVYPIGVSNTMQYDYTASYDGQVFALPIALVHRRNQGAYHPVYNPNGTAYEKSLTQNGSDKWYASSNGCNNIVNISQCFTLRASGDNLTGYMSVTGAIASTYSGRPDGLFYDQVHESDILDLRNSSKKVEDYNRLISREFNKLVAGSTRGTESELEGRYITITSTASNTGNDFINFSSTDNIKVKIGDVINVLYASSWSRQTVKAVYPTSIKFMNTFPKDANPTIAFGNQTTITKSNTLLHCDIIGNPTNYPTTWKQNGVFGTPLIVDEDGTSFLLPTGSKSTFKLSRKANATPLLCLRSTDNGATWTSFTPTFSTTTNEITLTNEPAANLVMVYYQTHTSMAVPTVNSEVLEVGKAVGTNGLANAHLISTLIGKVSTASTAPYLQDGYSISSYRIDTSTIKFSTTSNEIPLHNALSLAGGAVGISTVKILPYLTRLNGKAYLNLVFKEMKYNTTASQWGDDTKFNIVDNVSTTTDFYGSTVLIGQKTVELPYFIGGDE